MKVIASLVLLVGCAQRPATVCQTLVDCARHDGSRVAVEGTYVQTPHPKDHHDRVPEITRLRLDGEGPLLEAFWDPRQKRSRAEVTRYAGKRVRVTGIYRKQGPPNPADPPYAQVLGDPCIQSIESIELVESVETIAR